MFSEFGKCRCCIHPSTSVVKLTTLTKIAGLKDKTYNEILQEIANSTNLIADDITKLPQEICRKCVKQLKNAYLFIQQTRRTYEYYLRETRPIYEEKEDNGINEFENLDETLIEIPGAKASGDEDSIQEEVKIECSVIRREGCSADRLRSTDSFTNEDEDNFNTELEDKEECVFNIDDLEDSYDNRVQDDSPMRGDSSEEDEEEEPIDEVDIINVPIARRCDVCNKVYRDERALNIHKRFTHMPDDEKIPCPFCSYKTSRTSALKVHMGLIHGADKVEEFFKAVPVTGKKFPCNLCDRGYQRREDLRKHFRKKHKTPQSQLQPKQKEKPAKPRDEQSFLCASCGQSYSSKKALDGHLLSHTGERPYPCDICDKAFKRIKDMKAHRVIHSDDKPFQCTQCAKSFKRADKLKIHMRVHSELRPYKCRECEKSFKYPSVLRTHMHMHTGQTPFSCKTCGDAFSLRTSLNNHCLKTGHTK